jgi:hypothetical protein
MESQNQKCLATQLLKSFSFFCHPVVLVGGFADVDTMWQWDPSVSIFSLLSLLLSSLSFFFLLYRQPVAIPV